jgi:hypothetical protein
LRILARAHWHTGNVGRESVFELLLVFGIYHILAWGLGGLIAAMATAGFVGVTTERRWLVARVLSGFVGGGVIVALILAVLMRTGVGWNIYHAILLEILVPPAIGAAMLLRALNIVRTLDNSNASYSTRGAAG